MAVRFRAIMMFVLCMGTINLYSQRMCLSIAIICMTNHTATIGSSISSNTGPTDHALLSNETTCTGLNKNQQELEDGPFVWDRATRGHVLGVFFWGYLVGQIPSGLITQRFGARRVVLLSLVLLGLSTILIPVAVVHSIYLLYALRVIAGLASAAWFPGFYQVWASWAPPNERGLLVGLSYAGVHVGNAVTLPIAGALCKTSMGWPLVFYFYGASSLLYAVVWILFVYDTPTAHPIIPEKEKKFIVAVCGDSGRVQKRDSHLPIVAMLKSLPVWAFVVLSVGYDWNGYTMLTCIPAYMKEVLMFDIDENAGLSSLPYVGLWFGQLLCGWLSDFLLARKLLSVDIVRKIMTAIGMFGPGLMMLLISLFDCRYKYVVVSLFTIGLILNSGIFAGGMLNPIEISPKHSGIIFAGANTIGALTGVVAPLLASVLTPNKSYAEWRYVFYVGAAVYVIAGLFFVCCSSSKVQPWAIGPNDHWSSGELGIQTLADDTFKPAVHSELISSSAHNAIETGTKQGRRNENTTTYISTPNSESVQV